MHIDQAENNQHLNETLRIAKLDYYDILDTAAESAFDQLTQLAVAIFDVTHAGILFQAAEKVFVKSQIGSSSSNESVFYVSAPIITPDGFDIGKIYVADDQARACTEKQFNMLKLLADMVMEKLESRIAIRKAFRAYDDRLHVLIHDLKNPMTTISLQSELLGRIPGVDERASTIAGKINGQAKRMIDNLNSILSTARKEANSFKPKKTEVDLKEILEGVKLDLDLNLKRKAQNISINIENPLKIFGDLDKLKVIFSELINNAIKFSPKGENIILSGQITENEITIAIKDHGVGLNAEDLDKIFLKFPRLSAVATENENVYGLGLITANALIEIHKGKLWVESEGKDLGTTFFVSLPIK